MWLLSFAWRNRNLKKKQKGKREGKVEQNAVPHCRASPFLQYELRTATVYAWQTLPLQQANRLLKLEKTETTQTFLQSVSAKSLQHPRAALILQRSLDMHPACCSLHFEVVHRAMELWLSCPSQPFHSCSEPRAADCRSLGATATSRPTNGRSDSACEFLIESLLYLLSLHLSASQTEQLLMNGVIYSAQSVCPRSAALY